MTNHSSSSTQARVDLTSQDLRTGTLRLPIRMQNLLEEGASQALDTALEISHELFFSAPRDLSGLAQFFSSHELKPNDAVEIHFDTAGIRITPIYRHRRHQTRARQPHNSEVPEPTALQSASEATEHSAEQEPPEGGETHGSAARAPASGDPPDESLEDMLGITAEAGVDTIDYPGATLTEGREGDTPIEVGADTPVPDPGVGSEADPFRAFGQLEASTTDELLGLDDPLDSREADSLEAPDTPTAQPPSDGKDVGYEATEVGAPSSGTPLHHVARRTFGRPSVGRSAPVPIQVVSEIQASRKQADYGVPDARKQQADRPVPNPQQPLWDDVDRSPTSLLRGYLAQPDLPSVIQATRLASDLELPLDEVELVLGELSLEADARISSIRPDFYLVKRQGR